MSVWLCIPSARPDGGTARLWQDAGYKVALWRDPGADIPEWADYVVQGEYPGYARAVNELALNALRANKSCDWIVTGGDDIEPDPNHTPDEIARECTEHFGEYIGGYTQPRGELQTFGVMQPTGDRWGENDDMPNVRPDRKAYADRVCSSPWLGREFCQKMYGGQGPLWPGWQHMWVDEELQNVAEMYGVLWQRRDLVHFHRHHAREGKPVPPWLVVPNRTFHETKKLFDARKAQRFPGHAPLS